MITTTVYKQHNNSPFYLSVIIVKRCQLKSHLASCSTPTYLSVVIVKRCELQAERLWLSLCQCLVLRRAVNHCKHAANLRSQFTWDPVHEQRWHLLVKLHTTHNVTQS